MTLIMMDIPEQVLLSQPLEKRLGIFMALRKSLGDRHEEIFDELMAEAHRELADDYDDEADPDPSLIPTETFLKEFRAYLESDAVQSESAPGGDPTGVSIQHLLALPPEERIRIARVMMRSFEDGGIFPIADELADESNRRFDEHVADPESALPWESVRAELRDLLG